MKLSAEMTAFADRLGHRFSDPALLIEALTHPSVDSPARTRNQRLEFLGDRVLNLAVAEALFHAFPEAEEGELAPRYNELVRKETCAEIAAGIGLGQVLRMGRGEMMKGGRKRLSNTGDAMEAVLGAVFLDAGFDAARAVVLALWGERIRTAEGRSKDPKSALQEWAQGRGLEPPVYEVTDRSGPPHAPVFTILARLSTGQSAEATAGSKRQAEREAAERLLDQLPE